MLTDYFSEIEIDQSWKFLIIFQDLFQNFIYFLQESNIL